LTETGRPGLLGRQRAWQSWEPGGRARCRDHSRAAAL